MIRLLALLLLATPLSAAPAPIASTAMMGEAASAICSALWAARLDSARRWNEAGKDTGALRFKISGIGYRHYLASRTVRTSVPCAQGMASAVILGRKDLIPVHAILFEYVANAADADTHRSRRFGFAPLSTA